MSMFVLGLAVWAFTNWPLLDDKNKPSLTISHNHKALRTFHHDAPNSEVHRFNFLEFLVNGLLIISHDESAKHTCI